MSHLFPQGKEMRELGVCDAVEHCGLGGTGRPVSARLAILVDVEFRSAFGLIGRQPRLLTTVLQIGLAEVA